MKLLAALIFFTRLPFWRIAEVPPKHFKKVVELWPLTGLLTSGIMAFVLWISSLFFPIQIAVILSIISRLLITGALHEDGLADFFDGFGGGTNRDNILSIMKDSHIGTYGVISLALYFIMLYEMMLMFPVQLLCFIIISADTFSKAAAAQIINLLPYARKEEDSKSKVVYDRMSVPGFLFCAVSGTLPMLFMLDKTYWIAALAPVCILFILAHIMHKKIQGYTGDCCGATFILCELSFYMATIFINYNLC